LEPLARKCSCSKIAAVSELGWLTQLLLNWLVTRDSVTSAALARSPQALDGSGLKSFVQAILNVYNFRDSSGQWWKTALLNSSGGNGGKFSDSARKTALLNSRWAPNRDIPQRFRELKMSIAPWKLYVPGRDGRVMEILTI
jgi:hypothetical protein